MLWRPAGLWLAKMLRERLASHNLKKPGILPTWRRVTEQVWTGQVWIGLNRSEQVWKRFEKVWTGLNNFEQVKCGQVWTGLFEKIMVQTYSTLFKPVRSCSNLFNRVWAGLNRFLEKWFWVPLTLSRFEQVTWKVIWKLQKRSRFQQVDWKVNLSA